MDFTTDYKTLLNQDPYFSSTQEASSSSEPQQAVPSFQDDARKIQIQDNGGLNEVVGDAQRKAAVAQQEADTTISKLQMEQAQREEDDVRKAIEAYQSQGMPLSDHEGIANAQHTFRADMTGETQKGILGQAGVITQQFGNRNPVERYSKGVNYGVDIAVPQGTKVALPPGEWKIEEAFDKATASGANNAQGGINRGYGNSILATNTATGEKLRFSHLSQVGVIPGQTVQGGSVIGKSGATGNVTGPHLDLEMYNSQGRLTDVLRSNYAQFLVRR